MFQYIYLVLTINNIGHWAWGKQEVWEVWEDGEEIFLPYLLISPHTPHTPHTPSSPTRGLAQV